MIARIFDNFVEGIKFKDFRKILTEQRNYRNFDIPPGRESTIVLHNTLCAHGYYSGVIHDINSAYLEIHFFIQIT